MESEPQKGDLYFPPMRPRLAPDHPKPRRWRIGGLKMQSHKLGNTEIKVAPLALGGNVFGWTTDEAFPQPTFRGQWRTLSAACKPTTSICTKLTKTIRTRRWQRRWEPSRS